jgi:preprotein translocase subunit SecD
MGVIAAVALTLYASIFVTMLKIWPESFGGPIVLTLAGIAGIVLSIGLAVDGNILIFERLKEELKRGRSLHQAVDLGFERAWTAIKDSNLTTLLTCLILFSFGSSVIKGFAITLIVGTLLSMFTAVTISRNLLRFTLLFKSFRKKALFGVKEEDVDNAKNAVGAKIRKRK